MTAEPSDGMESFSEGLRRHAETEREYANYWKYSQDRKGEERDIAACLLTYLQAREGWAGANVASAEHDPPDCFGTTSDGRTFGIEVTELVHRPTVEGHQLRRNAERKGMPPPPNAADRWDAAIWTVAALRSEIVRIIHAKDKPAKGGPFAPYLVAIGTGEMSVTPALAADAISGMQIDSRYVDGAYLLLSYDPGAQSYPNCIPVLKLPVRKAEAKETSPHHVG